MVGRKRLAFVTSSRWVLMRHSADYYPPQASVNVKAYRVQPRIEMLMEMTHKTPQVMGESYNHPRHPPVPRFEGAAKAKAHVPQVCLLWGKCQSMTTLLTCPKVYLCRFYRTVLSELLPDGACRGVHDAHYWRRRITP